MNQIRAPHPPQSQSLQTLSEWLRCPNCFAALQPADALVLCCPNGHRFDVNRRGHISLMTGSRGLIGDSSTMLDARDAFLERGWYADVRDALSARVAAEDPTRVIDIGCGTGYYLRGVLAALVRDVPRSAEPHALAVDLSAAAVSRTVRASGQVPRTETAGLVADVWSPLPIRDGTADVVLNVFAPRNPVEFHRIVAPGGLLAVVIPHPTHLQELRAAGLALDVHENKAADLASGLDGLFALESSEDISSLLELSAADVAALIGMGPSAHHHSAAEASGSMTQVTVAFRLLYFRRTPE